MILNTKDLKIIHRLQCCGDGGGGGGGGSSEGYSGSTGNRGAGADNTDNSAVGTSSYSGSIGSIGDSERGAEARVRATNLQAPSSPWGEYSAAEMEAAMAQSNVQAQENDTQRTADIGGSEGVGTSLASSLARTVAKALGLPTKEPEKLSDTYTTESSRMSPTAFADAADLYSSQIDNLSLDTLSGLMSSMITQNLPGAVKAVGSGLKDYSSLKASALSDMGPLGASAFSQAVGTPSGTGVDQGDSNGAEHPLNGGAPAVQTPPIGNEPETLNPDASSSVDLTELLSGLYSPGGVGQTPTTGQPLPMGQTPNFRALQMPASTFNFLNPGSFLARR